MFLRACLMGLTICFIYFWCLGHDNTALRLSREIDHSNLDYVWQPTNDQYPVELSILIPTLQEPHRVALLAMLVKKFASQAKKCGSSGSIEILTFTDSRTFTTGYKRNVLIRQSHGRYVCFVDDDDDVSKSYVADILQALHKNPDVVAIKGIKTINRNFDNSDCYFFHSIKFDTPFPAPFFWNTVKRQLNQNEAAWHKIAIRRPNSTCSTVLCRYVCHLNPIRRDIAIKFPFCHVNSGEDVMWAQALYASGLLKKECAIDNVLYYYRYETALSASTDQTTRAARIK